MYVDDFKMVGKSENAGPMWKTLRRRMDLEPSTPLVDQVYLGCNQRDAEIDEELISTKAELFKRITTTSVSAGGGPRADSGQHSIMVSSDRNSSTSKAS